MKKFLAAFTVFALVAGVSQAASLKAGTQEIVVNGYYDPETVHGDAWDLGLAYGQFIQDLVEVGVQGEYATDDAAEVYGAGVFGEYNFDLGTEVVPFVGVSLGFQNTDIDNGESVDSGVLGGFGGVKYFLAENVAISADVELDWANDDVFADNEDFTDNQIVLNLGMRFFIP